MRQGKICRIHNGKMYQVGEVRFNWPASWGYYIACNLFSKYNIVKPLSASEFIERMDQRAQPLEEFTIKP